jgi:hypothetical protein
MASRPNRKPVITPKEVFDVGQEIGKAVAKNVKAKASTRAPAPSKGNASGSADIASQLASVLGSAGASPMEAAAPPMMGAPAMKKGGKVMKKEEGGMASSIRSAKDYHAADKDFVSTRAAHLGKMIGKAEGGKADIKQDKALVKKAVHKHEASMHPGKPLTKLRKGGMAC